MVTRLKSKAKKGKLRFKLPPLMRLKQGVTLTIMSCTCASVQHDDYIYSPRRVHKANIKTFHKSRFCGHKSQFFLFSFFFISTQPGPDPQHLNLTRVFTNSDFFLKIMSAGNPVLF